MRFWTSLGPKILCPSLKIIQRLKDSSCNKTSTVMKLAPFGTEMRKSSFVTQEEKVLPRHKPVKDGLIFLLYGNADCEVKH